MSQSVSRSVLEESFYFIAIIVNPVCPVFNTVINMLDIIGLNVSLSKVESTLDYQLAVRKCKQSADR